MKTFFLLAALALSLAGCKKDSDDNKPEKRIIGTWNGSTERLKMVTGSDTTRALPYSITFNDNGSAVYSTTPASVASSTYTVSDPKLTIVTKYVGVPQATTTVYTIQEVSDHKLALYTSVPNLSERWLTFTR